MGEAQPIVQPASKASLVALVVGTAAICAAVIAVPVLAFADKPLWYAPTLPIAVVAGMLFLWNTRYGLFFTAFAIAPLGVIQREFAGITLNLPEMMILALFAKEALLFFLRREKPVEFLPLPPLIWFAGAWFVGILTGFARGNYPMAVLQDFRQYFEFVTLYLLVIHRVTDRRQIVLTLCAFLFGLMLIAVHGIIQRYTGWGIADEQILSDQVLHSGIRSGSLYGATPLGALMVLAFGVTLGLALSVHSRTLRVIIGVCAAIAVVTAVFTYTRASWIAMAFALVVFFSGIKKTPFIIAVTIVLALLFSATLGSLVMHRMGKTEVSKRERSLLERFEYYTAAWHIFRAYPILGLGWGCEFKVTDINLNGRYVPPPPRMKRIEVVEIGEATLNARYLQTYQAVQAQSTVHSAYLQILVRTGIIGILPFLFFLAPWLRSLFRAILNRTHNLTDHNLYIGVSAGVLGYLVHALVENFFQWPVMAQSFWLLMGLTSVMAAGLRRRGAIDACEAATLPTQGGTA